MTECTQISFGWGPKNVVTAFDSESLSSDGGLVLVRSADEQLRLIERAAALLDDGREQGKIRHEIETILRQRVYGICAGYEDCNDADRLREDPLHRLVVGGALASSPTLSRFENGQGWKALKQLNGFLFDIARRDFKKSKKIIIDLDATDDETHGNQQLAFFHGYHDQHMYHPLLIYANDRLIHVLLRPGNCHAARGATSVLRPLLSKIRAISKATITLRADAGFAVPRLYDMLEEHNVTYMIGLITNNRLRSYADDAMAQANQLYKEHEKPVQRFGSVWHQADSWSHPRRVVYKAEHLHQGENRRFVVTNQQGVPEAIYTFYRQRGDMENRIKDLKNALKADRLSCHRFVTNFFRLLEHALAYVLMDHLRRSTTSPDTRKMQFDTLRLHLIKIGAVVKQSVRRYVVHMPKSYRLAQIFVETARVLAVPLPT